MLRGRLLVYDAGLAGGDLRGPDMSGVAVAADTTLDDDAGYAGGVQGVLHSGVEVADVGWDDNHGGCFCVLLATACLVATRTAAAMGECPGSLAGGAPEVLSMWGM